MSPEVQHLPGQHRDTVLKQGEKDKRLSWSNTRAPDAVSHKWRVPTWCVLSPAFSSSVWPGPSVTSLLEATEAKASALYLEQHHLQRPFSGTCALGSECQGWCLGLSCGWGMASWGMFIVLWTVPCDWSGL